MIINFWRCQNSYVEIDYFLFIFTFIHLLYIVVLFSLHQIYTNNSIELKNVDNLVKNLIYNKTPNSATAVYIYFSRL